ncbi:MAG: SDR family NAD(P)-dependent oxidoreductase, partial [Proteobacteria bacterium]|nr:SDR family NAD(P)-dependent oxidoreductase [Pseudomonadota bacterium]
MDLGIAGRKALVCGASAGLGYACAKALVEEQVDVVIVARTAETLSKEAEELRTKAVDAARLTQDREEEITTIERKLDKLNAELASRTAALGGKRAQLI